MEEKLKKSEKNSYYFFNAEKIEKELYVTTTTIYNDAGLPIEQIQDFVEAEKPNHTQIEYNASGQVVKVVNAGNGELIFLAEYDELGRKTLSREIEDESDLTTKIERVGAKEILSTYGADGELYHKDETIYNSDNKPVKLIKYDEELIATETTIWEYDEAQNTITEITYQNDLVVEKKVTQLNQEGLVISEEIYNEDGYLGGEVICVYDENGNKIEEIYRNEFEGVHTKETIKYNDNGNLVYQTIEGLRFTDNSIATKVVEQGYNEFGDLFFRETQFKNVLGEALDHTIEEIEIEYYD